jgi:hypothetical protein
MFFGLYTDRLIFYFLPLLFLLFLVIAYLRARYGFMLLWSILLVLFDLPHLLSFYTVMNGTFGVFAETDLSPFLILGVVCFVMGIVGIILSVIVRRAVI